LTLLILFDSFIEDFLESFQKENEPELLIEVDINFTFLEFLGKSFSVSKEDFLELFQYELE